jgi:hypothetical protein
MEQWKHIGTTNYDVSSLGNVRWGHFYDKNSSNLKVTINNKGYGIVGLRIDGRSKSCSVARLVAEAFIPNPHNLTHVTHKDGNRSNAKVENLEWSTMSGCKNNKTKYKGVCLHKATGKYQAYLTYQGTRYWLGRFNTEEEGAKAYQEKFKELTSNTNN